MNPPSKQARTASGQPLDLIGEIDCDVTLKGEHRSCKVYVTSINDLNLLCLDFIDLFHLLDDPLCTVCNFGARKREFGKGDSVHASTYIHGMLVWHTGTVIERVGNVMYNVWLEDKKRIIRSYTNQLRA